MSLKIAVDAGHGYVKAMAETGERVLFPSLIVPAPVGPNLGDFAGSASIQVNNQAYLIGESARLTATSLFSRDKATDPLTLALIWSGVAQLVGPGYHAVALGAGLPLSWYAAQKTALADALRGSVTVGNCHLLIDEVSVFPQGIGALLTANLPAQGLVGLVDIGYRTVDYLIAQVRDRIPAPIVDRSGTWIGGMHVAYQAISQVLEKDVRVRFEAHELMDRTAVTAKGQQIGLEPYRATAFQRLAADLSQHLATVWDGVIDKLDVLLLAGGGAMALQPYLVEFAASSLMSESQWANVQGYLNLLV